jgi:hypothetical protein
MVIVGAPGSGKTGAAVLLVLAALNHREQVPEMDRPRVPVPVMFTLHGWNPNTQPFPDWLGAELQRTYALFSGRKAYATATKFVRAGKVGVILDGLDEIHAELQPVALQALSQQALFRVVVLARSTEMVAAAQQGMLEGAVALELRDVDPSAAADYLTRVQLEPPPAGWRELVKRLRHTPNSPMAKALGNPLALTLVRDTYRSSDNVREFLDFCDSAGHAVSREDIEDHLLDRVLPAAYARQPGEAQPEYGPQAARQALSAIAWRMNQYQSRDLAWWHIRSWEPPLPRQVAAGLAAGLVAALGFGLVTGMGLVTGSGHGLRFRPLLWFGPHIRIPPLQQLGLGAAAVAGVVGLTLGFLTGFFSERMTSPSRYQPRRLRWTGPTKPLSRLALLIVILIGIGMVVGALAGFWASRFGVHRLTGRFVIGAVAGLWVILGLAFWDEPTPGDADLVTPAAAWRGNQVFAIEVGVAAGIAAGLLVGSGGLGGLAAGLWGALVVGIAVGLLVALYSADTWPTSLAFAQLAMRLHTPLRLIRFLEDARERNVLRTVGPIYQFRHARLQDRLAEQARWARSETEPAETAPRE